MRWEDERYVRLYTRDTTTWKLLCWQAKAMLPMVLRKLDRAGMLDLGDDGLEGLAAVIEMPLDVVAAAMHGTDSGAGLLARGVFVYGDDGRLVMPKFIEAQEVRQSDAQRKRVSREKARNNALLPGFGHDMSPAVTSGHQASPSVTDGHSVPSLAEPSLTEPDPPPSPPTGGRRAGARARDGSSAEQRYREAFAAGIRDASSDPFSLPAAKIGGILGPALQVHAKSADGSPLVGDALCAWIRGKTADWRRSADPTYAGGWSAYAFVKWLNTNVNQPSKSTVQSSNGRAWTMPQGANW